MTIVSALPVCYCDRCVGNVSSIIQLNYNMQRACKREKLAVPRWLRSDFSFRFFARDFFSSRLSIRDRESASDTGWIRVPAR